VFARITRELLRETDLGRLLRLIVDSAIALVGAERGFLLLDDSLGAMDSERPTDAPADTSPMRVRVARSFDHEDIPIPASRLSMGIAQKAIEVKQALLSVDAERDPRFSGMASVEDLRLRSVMCLPLIGSPERGNKVEGVLYVDNRLQQAAFSEDDLELMKLLADQASIAIRNARLLAELRERHERLVHSGRKIELLNEQLGRKVRDRDTELAVVRAELGRERGRYDYTAIVGASDGLRRVFQQLDRIIESELPVLIAGESGTGKELIARAIHFNGPRKDKPFVTENCAALPDTLLESELFGHTRGAFTGAHRAKKGLLEQADGGTLLLDEIGEISPALQAKLLRVLEEEEFERVGGSTTLKVDVRMIATTNRDLSAEVKAGRFREDLYYRLHVLPIHVQPLRERTRDIVPLAHHFLQHYAGSNGTPTPELSAAAEARLTQWSWPGNVRELENVIQRAVVLLQGTMVEASDLVFGNASGPIGIVGSGASAAPMPLANRQLADIEREAILDTLQCTGGNKTEAARRLGVSARTLSNKMKLWRQLGLVA